MPPFLFSDFEFSASKFMRWARMEPDLNTGQSLQRFQIKWPTQSSLRWRRHVWHLHPLEHLERRSPGVTGKIAMRIVTTQKWKIGLLWWSAGWETSCQHRGHRFNPWSGNKDPTWQGATKPMCHNSWSPCGLEPVLRSKRSHCNEKPAPQQRVDPTCRIKRKPARSNQEPVQLKIK